MADIATVFHWPPSEMWPMPLSELVAWRERARVRNTPDED
ncbi:MAG: GpE family phage tail protein [Proteobacteria bacterium]|nr:GpE family phage tail protein [Pseudomonadota bacterium]